MVFCFCLCLLDLCKIRQSWEPLGSGAVFGLIPRAFARKRKFMAANLASEALMFMGIGLSAGFTAWGLSFLWLSVKGAVGVVGGSD